VAPAPAAEVKIGRCVGIEQLAETKAAGFDYGELGVSGIARLSDEAFEKAVATHAAVGLPTPAANGFIPGEVKLTGAEADREKQMAYVRKALDRMARLGVKIVVMGSAGARNVPEGFSRDEAWRQLVDFGKRLAPEAEKRGIVIAVEPLRRQESNIINTAAEGLRLVEAVGHSHFQLMVDFYHLASENEDPDILLTAREHIRHFHFANPNGRVFPLDASEYDYARFFDNIRKIGFQGGLSVEARPKDGIAQDGPRTVTFLHAALGGRTY
jgi:sugar phosphate isomerase/epimerase